jgi:hypothetical protein
MDNQPLVKVGLLFVLEYSRPSKKAIMLLKFRMDEAGRLYKINVVTVNPAGPELKC